MKIRAGAGFRPIIKSNPIGNQKFRALLQTNAPLVLEGLAIERIGPETPKNDDWWVIVYSDMAPLYAANCRFVVRDVHTAISATSPICQLRNCEILCTEDRFALVWSADRSDSRLLIDNCLHAAGRIVLGSDVPDGKEPASVRVTRSTSVTGHGSLRFQLRLDHLQRLLKANAGAKALRVEASGNVFDSITGFSDFVLFGEPQGGDAEALLAAAAAWQGQRNLYAVKGPYLALGAIPRPSETVKRLADWKKFWGTTESDSTEGIVRYQGGNLMAKLHDTLEHITPEDFRLRPDSAGYKAGKDAKDLGADVDLVGPGPAYERWRTTTAYQQWLKDSGQVKK